jgi:hypothetical protein
MKDQLNAVLDFFYDEKGKVSAYNNRFIFGVPDTEFYRIVDELEEKKLIEAVGIRHTIQGYNLYKITRSGIEFKEAGGF